MDERTDLTGLQRCKILQIASGVIGDLATINIYMHEVK